MSATLDHRLREARERVAAAARELAAERLVEGTAGNVSERVDELVAVSPTGARLHQLTASEVTVVDLSGEVVGGELAPTSELQLHLELYRRHRAGAVVHTHAPMATAVGCVVDELPAVHYAMLAFGGTVPVVPYLTFGSAELARACGDALGDRAVALMSNHGTIAHAHDLAHAVEHTRMLEWACTVYWRAASIGTPRTLSAADLAGVVEMISRRSYGSTQAI